MQFSLRDGRVVMLSLPGNPDLVRGSEPGDDRACKCCAFECNAELAIEVTFCGMTLNTTVQIPGFTDFAEVILPDGSYILLSAQIGCGPCGWELNIGICAYCDSTQVAASDAFLGTIPFAATEETLGAGYCPESGAVDLECFGEQFGIPCVTTATASIA